MPYRRLAFVLFATLLAGCDRGKSLPTAPVAGPATSISTDRRDVNVPALIEQAVHHAGASDFVEALRLLDQVLAVEPTNRKALLLASRAAQDQGQLLQRPRNSPYYLRSAEAIRKLRAAHRDLDEEEQRFLRMVLYNEACTLAVNGESARAVQALGEAYEAGFPDAEQLDLDNELDSLRRLPEFHALQRKVERRRVESLLAVSKPFKFGFSLFDLEGKKVDLGDFQGKVTIVDLWGTWCPPCRKEVPHLVDLYKRYHAKGLEIVGVNYENEEGDAAREAISAFAKEYGVEYPCVIGDDATQNQVPGFEGYPTTLFLDRAGNVRVKAVGYHTLAALETIVTMLLEEKTKE